jgi:hypothetical protein
MCVAAVAPPPTTTPSEAGPHVRRTFPTIGPNYSGFEHPSGYPHVAADAATVFIPATTTDASTTTVFEIPQLHVVAYRVRYSGSDSRPRQAANGIARISLSRTNDGGNSRLVVSREVDISLS